MDWHCGTNNRKHGMNNMRIRFTRDGMNERYIDGITITSKNGGVLEIFVCKFDLKKVFTFLRDGEDWMIRFWIFNMQYTNKDSSFCYLNEEPTIWKDDESR